MIRIDHVSKTFRTKDREVRALQDVTLHIQKGEIYGIVGFSGAGKSTLIRLVNRLETPDIGEVRVEGKLLSELKSRELTELRREIGMVFQSFNLLEGKTVYRNIAIPLLMEKRPKAEIEKRVAEVLEFVELSDKKNAYVSQLSGGQKQRVAIARALASKPRILLSDEATSALDPEATESILSLLKDLNRRLGITVVLITHEMSVIKSIAGRVAVMEDGRIVEEGSVYDIFSSPREEITRKFVASSSLLGNLNRLLEEDSELFRVKKGELLVRLTFDQQYVGQAVITTAARRFGFDLNLILASAEVLHGSPIGGIVGILSGEREQIRQGIAYMEENHVKTEVLRDGSLSGL